MQPDTEGQIQSPLAASARADGSAVYLSVDEPSPLGVASHHVQRNVVRRGSLTDVKQWYLLLM